jgi:hypothetical protein
MTTHQVAPAGSVWREDRLPLPGLYPVLTLQANVTVHRATGLSKFVVIVREPNDHQEISRRFSDLVATPGALRAAIDVFHGAVLDMDHLMGGRGI